MTWTDTIDSLTTISRGGGIEVLTIVPCFSEQKKVHEFIARHHRHHKPPVGDVFRLACVDEDGMVRGVATIGRPVARGWDDGRTLEVTRLATDGARNACSMLYGAARRIAWAMGATRLCTFTLPKEGGASLRASGWVCDGVVRRDGLGWSTRPGRKENHPQAKHRWTAENSRGWDGPIKWPDEDNEELPPMLAYIEAMGG